MKNRFLENLTTTYYIIFVPLFALTDFKKAFPVNLIFDFLLLQLTNGRARSIVQMKR